MVTLGLLALVLTSELIARLLDRRKHKNAGEQWDDDTASPL